MKLLQVRSANASEQSVGDEALRSQEEPSKEAKREAFLYERSQIRLKQANRRKRLEDRGCTNGKPRPGCGKRGNWEIAFFGSCKDFGGEDFYCCQNKIPRSGLPVARQNQCYSDDASDITPNMLNACLLPRCADSSDIVHAMTRFNSAVPTFKTIQRFPQRSLKKTKKGKTCKTVVLHNGRNCLHLSGAQSCRNLAHGMYGGLFSNFDDHTKSVFQQALQCEHSFGANWVVLYHCYNTAVLLYEVQAAIANLLFGFNSAASVLPRLRLTKFQSIPHAHSLLTAFPSWGTLRDCCAEFKNIGICCSTSLLSQDPEATPLNYFSCGYQITNITLSDIIALLKDCGLPDVDARDLASKAKGIIESSFKSSSKGHMLQIFIRREFVDYWAYPSLPYGVPDPARSLLSACTAEKERRVVGQARVVANPLAFMLPNCVRLFSYSSDPAFHCSRQALQSKLAVLFKPAFQSATQREACIKHIFGGSLPPKTWFEVVGKARPSEALHAAQIAEQPNVTERQTEITSCERVVHGSVETMPPPVVSA
jgi:hypothetical protein